MGIGRGGVSHLALVLRTLQSDGDQAPWRINGDPGLPDKPAHQSIALSGAIKTQTGGIVDHNLGSPNSDGKADSTVSSASQHDPMCWSPIIVQASSDALNMSGTLPTGDPGAPTETRPDHQRSRAPRQQLESLVYQRLLR